MFKSTIDASRDGAVHARLAARSNGSEGGARVGSIGDTAYDVIILAGIGFVLWVGFGMVLPALFGAATKTKHSYKELRGHRTSDVHTRTQLKGHTPDDWDEYLAASRKSRSSVIDAEFEPSNQYIRPYHDR